MSAGVGALRRGVVAAAILLCASAGVARAATDSPRAVVEALTNAVMNVLADKGTSTDVKREKIEDLVYRNVDFDTVARLILARNWQDFSPDQKQQFIQEFKKHLSVTYGKSVDSYKNERVVITGDREEARGDWTVQTKILRGGPDDILVDYRLRKTKEGAWRIIDVIIERVSLVASFRSQIQEAMSHGGADNVIKLLRDKNARGESLKS